MSSIERLARATTTWLTRSGRINDLTTLSDRDLRDLGLVRREIGFNHQQVISVDRAKWLVHRPSVTTK
jgi:uncharacterized protein YjiS (DUF1127 family)